MTIHHASFMSRVLACAAAPLLIGALSACGGGAGGASGGTTPSGEAAEGKTADELSVTPVTGEGPKSLAEAKRKVVIVDFGGARDGTGALTLGQQQLHRAQLADVGGGHGQLVIVDFWATYCDPCRKSFPKYQEMVDQFGGDLAVIAVSVDDPSDVQEEKLKEFAAETGVKFSVVWDKEHKTAGLYSPPKMPTSFVIDKEGKIVHRHAGYESGEEDKIAEEVKALIGK